MNWENLLEEKNTGKTGNTFKTPKAFMTSLEKLRSMHSIQFRLLEGIAKIFSRITGTKTVCYTSIFMGIKNIVPSLELNEGKPLDCAIDPTGFKIIINGDYI
jgi:hypothetical protein